MSFPRMKVRYDDKTISYVKTFPRIWIMAEHPKYLNAFSFSLLLSIIHFCHQSSSIHLKNLSKSQKHVYIININIGSYQYQEG